MLRGFRPGDLPAYYDLMTGAFPEENRLLGWNRDPFFHIVRRLGRLDYRIILGLLNAVGRPLFRFFVVESDGEFAASALETFGPVSAYVGSVVVAPKFRRRGYARQILAACHAAARKRGRTHVVLDVLDENAAARALYGSIGYRPVGHGAHLARTSEPPRLVGGSSPRVRDFLRSDEDSLAALAASQVSPARLAVQPVRASDFAVPAAVVRALDSRTAAWVVDAGAGPVAWVRASVSPAMAAGHLSAPVVAPSADPADVQALLATALEWNRSNGAVRSVVEAWDENTRGLAALRAAGFEVAYGVQTLAFPLRDG